MSLAPLLDAAPAIPLHAFAAMTAFALGVVQFAAPKGTLPHRTIGWIWVCLMVGKPFRANFLIAEASTVNEVSKAGFTAPATSVAGHRKSLKN
jgi:uncharacterized membrane protein